MELRKQAERRIVPEPPGASVPANSQPAFTEPVPDPDPTSLVGKPVSLMNIRDRYSVIFEMYDQGKSTDHIAKKLDMTKGEVNLIVQLAKQEEQIRV
jgi:DNA-binding NarL/FixJ family response regulator